MIFQTAVQKPPSIQLRIFSANEEFSTAVRSNYWSYVCRNDLSKLLTQANQSMQSDESIQLKSCPILFKYDPACLKIRWRKRKKTEHIAAATRVGGGCWFMRLVGYVGADFNLLLRL